MSKTQENPNEESENKLLIWFCGTAEMKSNTRRSLKAMRAKHPHIKIAIIDGVASPENIMASKKMQNEEVSRAHFLNPYVMKDAIFDGYNEANHLVQQVQAQDAIHDHIEGLIDRDVQAHMEQHKEDRLTEDEVAAIKLNVTEHVKEHMKGYMDGHMKHIVKNLYHMDQDPSDADILRYSQKDPKQYNKEFKKVFGKEWDREYNKVYKQQIREAYMGQYMSGYEPPKTHLITGGYSRGGDVGEPAFLASLSAFSGTRLLKKKPTSEEEAKNQVGGSELERLFQTTPLEQTPTLEQEAKSPVAGSASEELTSEEEAKSQVEGLELGEPTLEQEAKSTEKEQEVDGITLFKKYFNKLSVIAVDPVPGLDQQDTFGLETMSDQENPLQEIFENLYKNLGIPIDVTYMPAAFERVKGLEGGHIWRNLLENLPQGTNGETLQAGMGHLAMTFQIAGVGIRYKKDATPRDLLNRILEEKLDIVPEGAKSSKEIHQLVAQRDREIITNLALGKFPAGSEFIATAAKWGLKLLHPLVGKYGELVNIQKELKQQLQVQLEDPDAPRLVNGRPLDAAALGLGLNDKGKLKKLPDTPNQSQEAALGLGPKEPQAINYGAMALGQAQPQPQGEAKVEEAEKTEMDLTQQQQQPRGRSL